MRRDREFRELVSDLDAAERERLRRVHDLLLAVGPPPELPPQLERAPGARRAQPSFAGALPPRRRRAALALAFVAAVAAFAVGYLAGGGGETSDRTLGVSNVRRLVMESTGVQPGAAGMIQVGREDEGGNTPLLLDTYGLEDLGRRGYYELWLTRRGERVVSCGTFVADEPRLRVRLNAPYTLQGETGWVVVEHVRDGDRERERVVLRT